MTGIAEKGWHSPPGLGHIAGRPNHLLGFSPGIAPERYQLLARLGHTEHRHRSQNTHDQGTPLRNSTLRGQKVERDKCTQKQGDGNRQLGLVGTCVDGLYFGSGHEIPEDA